jgi:nucleoside triphosphate pyrophosphatase
VSERTVILLASNSPRRRELIALGNWTVGLSVSDVDESQRPGESPADYVLRLAEAKARAALANGGQAQVVLAADTAVIYGPKEHSTILGKPTDAAEAVQMLKNLRGRIHHVYTGLAVIEISTGQLLKDLCITKVPMRNYGDAEIEAYVQTGDPLDKAGAYAIQDARFQPVESLRGCFASVMGLPMCHLVRLLAKIGITPNADVPANCQTYLHYQCPVSAAILRGEQAG